MLGKRRRIIIAIISKCVCVFFAFLILLVHAKIGFVGDVDKLQAIISIIYMPIIIRCITFDHFFLLSPNRVRARDRARTYTHPNDQFDKIDIIMI